MAGVTDLPFRRLCRRLGAALAAGEMLTSDARLWNTPKSRRRLDHSGEPEPRVVQIAGGDPQMMADAARRNVDAGAQIIDINMGCPAKKVCNKDAGLGAAARRGAGRGDPRGHRARRGRAGDAQDPHRLAPDARNGVRVARIAEDAGIRALAVHGRTRACRFDGEAEYETIAAIKQAVRIPVIANGDIDSAAKAAAGAVAQTGADGVMIGRAAQGRPWIFREVEACSPAGRCRAEPCAAEVRDIMLAHLRDLYDFYGRRPASESRASTSAGIAGSVRRRRPSVSP